MTTHHASSLAIIRNGIGTERVSEPLEPVAGDDSAVMLGGEGRGEASIADMGGLELKLKELEKEKSALDVRRSRVEEDIAALQRVMQLIASKNGSRDVVALGLECA
jgi:hypothetical protein